MYKGNKKLILILATPVVLLLLVAVGERLRGIVQLRAYVRHLEAKGEQLDYRKLLPPVPPKEDNIVTHMVEVARARDSFEQLAFRSPPFRNSSTSGVRRVVFKDDRWIWYDYLTDSDTPRTNNWPSFLEEFEQIEPLIESMMSAIRKPGFRMDADYEHGFFDINLGELKAVRWPGTWLGIAAVANLRRGNLPSAVEKLKVQSRLITSLGEGQFIILEFSRYAVFSSVFDTLWQCLQAEGWTEQQLAEMQKQWEGWDFQSDFERALVMERATTDNWIKVVGGDASARERYIRKWKIGHSTGLGGTYSDPEWFFVFVRLGGWRLIWQEQDRLAMLQYYDQLIGNQRLARTNSWAIVQKRTGAGTNDVFSVIRSAADDPPWHQRVRFLFSSQYQLDEDILEAAAKAQTTRNLGLAAIALHRFRLATGKWPESVDELVPVYLSAVPRDPMDGKKLRYHYNSGGYFKLYSVGNNFVDDGGDASPTPARNYYNHIWHGRDVVWPMPATNAISRN